MRAKQFIAGVLGVFILLVALIIPGSKAIAFVEVQQQVTVSTSTPTPEIPQQTSVLSVKRGGYSDVCWNNILLGLERLGDGSNFLEIAPRDWSDYNADIGSMEATADFITIDATPGACLCDLASWVAQAAINSMMLRPEADQWSHGKYDIKDADRNITIWHVQLDDKCYANEKYIGGEGCTLDSNEQNLLIYNDSNTETVRFGWNADDTGIEFWVQILSSGQETPDWTETKNNYSDVCGMPFDLTDDQWVARSGFHTGCENRESPCEDIKGDDYWPAPGLNPYGISDDVTSSQYPVNLLATLNGNVTQASTTTWNLEKINENGEKGAWDCTSGCDGAGNSLVVIENGGWTVYYLHPDQVFVSVGQEIKIGDVIGIMGDVGWSTATHVHYSVQKKDVPLGEEDNLNIQELQESFVCQWDGQVITPPDSGETATIVTDILELPFIEEALKSEVGCDEEIEDPEAILWQKTAEENPNSCSGYDVLVTKDEVTINNGSWAVAQIVDETPSSTLTVAFVDEGDNLPTPAQEITMQAITLVWMSVNDIPASKVREDGTDVNIKEEREFLQEQINDPEGTKLSVILSHAPSSSTEKPQKTFLNLDWKSSVPFTGIVAMRLVLVAITGILLALLITGWMYNVSHNKKLLEEREVIKRDEPASISKAEYQKMQEHERLVKRARKITTVNLVLVTTFAIGFITNLVVYTPISYRPEVIEGVRKAQNVPQQPPDDKDEAVNDQQSLQTSDIPSISDPLWQKIAEESTYPNWEFLRTACRDHNVPRGSNGRPLDEKDGGKVFPCWWVASIPSVETNDAEWKDVDPRKPGPWGYSVGWDTCPDWFKLTAQEKLEGKTISGMAQACRDGLKVIASNSVVQSRWTGITAQQIYSSGAGAVGRGQTLAMHFRSGALLGDLENMDVWSTNDVAVEAIVRHLVTRYNKETCGANENWYYTGNVEQARCAYNPGAWGIDKYSWYWDGMRQQANKIKTSLTAHESELAGLYVIPDVPATPVTPPAPKKDNDNGQVEIETKPGNRLTVGSGAYTIYDTIPSLVLRLVREADDGTDPKYKMWEKLIVNFGRIFYRSEDVRVNLGFDKIP